METLRGIGGSGGLVVGRLHFFDNAVRQVGPAPAADSRAELERFEAARAETLGILDALQRRAREEAGPDEARIFEIHRIMLTDPDFEERVTDRIVGQGLTAEYAVQEAGRELAQMLAAMDDAYMRERSADVTDVCNGVMRRLRGEKEADLPGGGAEPWVLAARHLLPSEVVRIERGRVLALVTSGGSQMSHACILARTMGVPAVTRVGEGLFTLREGGLLEVNGFTGEVFADPDERTLMAVREGCHGPRAQSG